MMSESTLLVPQATVDNVSPFASSYCHVPRSFASDLERTRQLLREKAQDGTRGTHTQRLFNGVRHRSQTNATTEGAGNASSPPPASSSAPSPAVAPIPLLVEPIVDFAAVFAAPVLQQQRENGPGASILAASDGASGAFSAWAKQDHNNNNNNNATAPSQNKSKSSTVAVAAAAKSTGKRDGVKGATATSQPGGNPPPLRAVRRKRFEIERAKTQQRLREEAIKLPLNATRTTTQRRAMFSRDFTRARFGTKIYLQQNPHAQLSRTKLNRQLSFEDAAWSTLEVVVAWEKGATAKQSSAAASPPREQLPTGRGGKRRRAPPRFIVTMQNSSGRRRLRKELLLQRQQEAAAADTNAARGGEGGLLDVRAILSRPYDGPVVSSDYKATRLLPPLRGPQPRDRSHSRSLMGSPSRRLNGMPPSGNAVIIEPPSFFTELFPSPSPALPHGRTFGEDSLASSMTVRREDMLDDSQTNSWHSLYTPVLASRGAANPHSSQYRGRSERSHHSMARGGGGGGGGKGKQESLRNPRLAKLCLMDAPPPPSTRDGASSPLGGVVATSHAAHEPNSTVIDKLLEYQKTVQEGQLERSTALDFWFRASDPVKGLCRPTASSLHAGGGLMTATGGGSRRVGTHQAEGEGNQEEGLSFLSPEERLVQTRRGAMDTERQRTRKRTEQKPSPPRRRSTIAANLDASSAPPPHHNEGNNNKRSANDDDGSHHILLADYHGPNHRTYHPHHALGGVALGPSSSSSQGPPTTTAGGAPAATGGVETSAAAPTAKRIKELLATVFVKGGNIASYLRQMERDAKTGGARELDQRRSNKDRLGGGSQPRCL